jgi:hypothetical protein
MEVSPIITPIEFVSGFAGGVVLLTVLSAPVESPPWFPQEVKIVEITMANKNVRIDSCYLCP